MSDDIVKAIRAAKRSVVLDPGETDDTTQSINLSFLSNESGLNYWPGIGMVNEIIDVTPASVDLTLLNSGAAPLLMEHDVDRQVGVVDSAEIVTQAGRFVGRALVRFSPNDPNAIIAYKDVVDKIRRNVSCLYDIVSYSSLGTDPANGYPNMKATKIQVQEISIVALPFDWSVGTDRAGGEKGNPQEPRVEPLETINRKEIEMTDEEKAALSAGKITADQIATIERAAQAKGSVEGELEGAKRGACDAITRATDILDYAESFGVDLVCARKFIGDGKISR
jgi:hypothetical protein